jgi:hypothetical protein
VPSEITAADSGIGVPCCTGIIGAWVGVGVLGGGLVIDKVGLLVTVGMVVGSRVIFVGESIVDVGWEGVGTEDIIIEQAARKIMITAGNTKWG